MALCRYTTDWQNTLSAAPRSIALGVFDGLHIGHRAVIAAACGAKDAVTGGMLRATVLSMTGAPKTVAGRLLTSTKEDSLLETLGAEEWIELCFEKVRHLSPKEFVNTVLHEQLGARHICCGYNYRFGKDGKGDAECLKELCRALGITVTVVPPMFCEGEPVSSTRIRAALAKGKMETAARLLGCPFTVDFPVTEGKHTGNTWGTPTINQVFSPQHTVPKYGVYASLTVIDGKQYFGVTNIGVHPTVGALKTPQAETWISGFSGDLYGKNVPVQLIRFLREERRFDTVEELKQQILVDEKNAHDTLCGARGERAVLLDFDDTLQDRFAAVLEANMVLMQQHMPYATEQERKKRARKMAQENSGGYVNYNLFFEDLLQRWRWEGVSSVEELLKEFHLEFPRHVKLFDETVTVLQELKRRGYRIGIITNGRSIVQHRKLDLCGIKPYVDTVVVSGEEGVHKPNAELFLRAAARLCVSPKNCVMVGDHPTNDIAGALGAGMKAIYLNSVGRDEHPENVPEVTRLHDVLQLL